MGWVWTGESVWVGFGLGRGSQCREGLDCGGRVSMDRTWAREGESV